MIFIELAYVFSCAVTVYSCKKDPNGPFHVLIPLVTLILVFQYGAFLRGEIPAKKMQLRWLLGRV